MSKLRLAKQRIDMRQSFRVSGRNPLEVKVTRSRALRSLRGRRVSTVTEDVSVTGLRFRSPIEFFPGVELKMQARLPVDTHTYRLLGVVQWCRALPDDAAIWETGVALLRPTSRASRDWARAVYEIIRSRSQVTEVSTLLQRRPKRRSLFG